MDRRDFIRASMAAVFLPGTISSLGCSAPPKKPALVPAQAGFKKKIRYGFTLENSGNVNLRDQAFYFYLPVPKTSTQSVEYVKIDMPHSIIRDDFGNSFARIGFGDFPPYVSRLVTVESVVMCGYEPKINGAALRPDYVTSEPLVDLSDEKLIALAMDLRKESQVETARSIYEWVSSNLKYAGFVAEDRGASRALRELRGDCTEYAYLVCALARANKIPARVIGGYQLDQFATVQPEGYHNWVELYLNDRWWVVDAQRPYFMEGQNDRVAFEVCTTVPSAMKGAHRYRVEGELRARMGVNTQKPGVQGVV